MENRKMTKKEQTDFKVALVKKDLYHMKKEDLRYILTDMLGVDIKKTVTNDELIKTIIKTCGNKKTPYLNIYDKFRFYYFGISLSEVEETFKINRYKRKELEKYYLLSVAYTYEVRAYGTYLDVPVYYAESVFDLLGEDIDALLKEERRLARQIKKSKVD